MCYPLPHHDALSLGLHFTKTLWGTILVGPTAAYVDHKENYERDRLTIPEFLADARTMLPDLAESDLQLAYTGLRPKLLPEGKAGFIDFVIEPDQEMPQIIQLIGIESPGLTASPAIARSFQVWSRPF